MTEQNERKPEMGKHDLLGLFLSGVGGLFFVSILLSFGERAPREVIWTAPFVGLIEGIGRAAGLLLAAGVAASGALLFLGRRVAGTGRRLFCLFAAALGLALLVGGIVPASAAGGLLGRALPDLLPGLAGRLLGALLGVAVLLAAAVPLLPAAKGPRAPRSPRQKRAEGPSLESRDGGDGVSAAEAEALTPAPRELPSWTPPASPYPPDVRLDGRVPAGARPIGADPRRPAPAPAPREEPPRTSYVPASAQPFGLRAPETRAQPIEGASLPAQPVWERVGALSKTTPTVEPAEPWEEPAALRERASVRPIEPEAEAAADEEAVEPDTEAEDAAAIASEAEAESAREPEPAPEPPRALRPAPLAPPPAAVEPVVEPSRPAKESRRSARAERTQRTPAEAPPAPARADAAAREAAPPPAPKGRRRGAPAEPAPAELEAADAERPRPPAWEQAGLFDENDPMRHEPEPREALGERVLAAEIAELEALAAPAEDGLVLEDEEAAEEEVEALEAELEEEAELADDEADEEDLEEADEDDEDGLAAELEEDASDEEELEDEDEDEEAFLEEDEDEADDEESLEEDEDAELVAASDEGSEADEPLKVLAPAAARAPAPASAAADAPADAEDGLGFAQLVHDAGCAVIEHNRVAVSMLQRSFQLDFDQACRVLDELQERGLIGPYMGGRTRDILLTREEWEAQAPAV